MSSAELGNLKVVLLRQSKARTYDDILLLKSFLSKTEFFQKHLAEASPKLLDELYRNSYLETFEEGKTIFKQGDQGDKVYIILSGEVEIRSKHEIDLGNAIETREKVFCVLSHGQCFGERALVMTEPRSASAVCVNKLCEMISISKDSYLGAIKSVQISEEVSDNHLQGFKQGSKDHVINILQKSRHHRNHQEISVVANYLESRVPFFQKFNSQQLEELCRVIDIISVRGRNVLFKQGSYGQGFYVIITGSVDVHARPTSEYENSMTNSPSSQTTANTHNTSMGMEGLIASLGERVNQLRPGDVFGERALESDSSLRMGSVITCEDLTQLLVIAKEDFLNLVSFISQSDIMEKIAVLRKTNLFQSVDGIHLRALAKCMYPRLLHIDEILYRAGDDLDMMCIVNTGELWAEIEVEPTLPEGYVLTKSAARLNLRGKQHVDLGRIGPYSVLGKGILLSKSINDQTIATSAVVASTLVEYFSVTKIDFLLHLPADSKKALAQAYQSFVPPVMPQLWDDGGFVVNDHDWKVKRAWKRFREDLCHRDSVESSDLVKNFRDMKDIHLKSNVPDDVLEAAFNLNQPHPEKIFQDQSVTYVNGLKSPSRNGAIYLEKNDLASPKMSGNKYNAAVLNAVGPDWGTPAAIAREKQARISKAYGKTRKSFSRNRGSSMDSGDSQTTSSYAFNDDKDVMKAIERGKSRDVMRERIQESESYANISSRTLSKGAGALLLSPVAAHRSSTNIMGESAIKSSPTKKNVYIPSDKISSLQQHPFTLIQYHREIVGNDRAAGDISMASGNSSSINMRRVPKTHMRLCGTMASCHNAKELAHLLTKSILVNLYQADVASEEELLLNWRVFHGFDSLSMQNSDYFIIYCKNTPIESAYLSPSRSLLQHDFPAACKIYGQRFACALMKPILNPSLDLSSYNSIVQSPGSNNRSSPIGQASAAASRYNIQGSRPVFVSELSSVVEIIGTALSQYECLRYALLEDIEEESTHTSGSTGPAGFHQDKSHGIGKHATHQERNVTISNVYQRGKRLLKQRLQQQSDIHIHVFPLYEWIVIDQQCLDMSQVERALESEENPVVDVKLSKYYNKQNDDELAHELEVSLKETGLLRTGTANPLLLSSHDKSKSQYAVSFNANPKVVQILQTELARRDLSSRLSQYQDSKNDESTLHSGSMDSLSAEIRSISEESMQSYYKKLLAPREDYLQLTRNRLESLKALADARNKILTLNDTVCDSENTLTSALHACHAEGLPISAVKFKKKTLRTVTPGLSNRVSTVITNPFAIRDDGIVRRKAPVYTVDEKILRTIEQSIKGKDSRIKTLEQEIELGLGLTSKRRELNESLVNIPTYASITKQRELEAKLEADRLNIAPVIMAQNNLPQKLKALESMLRHPSY